MKEYKRKDSLKHFLQSRKIVSDFSWLLLKMPVIRNPKIRVILLVPTTLEG